MMSSEIAIVTYDTSDVPSEVLVRLLVGTQQLVLLLGAAQENRTLDRRFRPTEEIRARYQLRVGLTRRGSYVVPVSVVNYDGLLNLPWEDPTPKVGELIDSANRRDWAAFGRILPDPGYSHRAMSVLNEMAPRAGEAWSAQWRAGSLTSPIDVELGRKVKDHLDRPRYSSQPMTITGLVITARFSQHGAEVRLPKFSRTLAFPYPDEFEDQLVERRRDWVQLTGSFSVDEENIPVEVIEVTSVEPLDLSVMRIDAVRWDHVTLMATQPLLLQPQLDDEVNQYLEVSEPTLDLIAFGRNRNELADAVAREIVTAWRLYVHENPLLLTPSAQALADRLQNRFTEETNATEST